MKDFALTDRHRSLEILLSAIIVLASAGQYSNAASEAYIASRVKSEKKSLMGRLKKLYATRLQPWQKIKREDLTVDFQDDEQKANYKILPANAPDYVYTDTLPKSGQGIRVLYKYHWSDGRNMPLIYADGRNSGVSRYWRRMFFNGKKWTDRVPGEEALGITRASILSALDNIYYIVLKKEMPFYKEKLELKKAIDSVREGREIPESTLSTIKDNCAKIAARTGGQAYLTSIYLNLAKIEWAGEPAEKIEAAYAAIRSVVNFGKPFTQ